MNDTELRDWQSQWQQGHIDVSRAHARARRDDRRHRWLAVTEYLTMALLLASTLGYALWRDALEVWAWMAAIWVLGVPALVFAWWNRRGLWGSADMTAHAHLQLSLQRCHRSLRALRIGYASLVASAALVLLFAFGVVGGRAGTQVSMLVWLAVVVTIHVVVMLVMQRRLRRRMRALSAMLHEMEQHTL